MLYKYIYLLLMLTAPPQIKDLYTEQKEYLPTYKCVRNFVSQCVFSYLLFPFRYKHIRLQKRDRDSNKRS